VREAFRGNRQIKAVFVSELRHRVLREMKKEAEARGIPFHIAGRDFFDLHFMKGHQGVAAEVIPKGYTPIQELLNIPVQKQENPFFLVLDCIEDPRNFGAILRVADAAGIHGIVIQSRRSVTLEADVSKASAGAVEYVPVCMVPNIKHALREMKEAGIFILGADEDAERNVWETDLAVPLAMVMGSEGKGVRRTVAGLCDLRVKIPMQGAIHSLNVSVATGIFAFEILRQRSQKS
jgi:23S rRNA (guanosine2251-2'-O)-methyltransferase